MLPCGWDTAQRTPRTAPCRVRDLGAAPSPGEDPHAAPDRASRAALSHAEHRQRRHRALLRMAEVARDQCLSKRGKTMGTKANGWQVCGGLWGGLRSTQGGGPARDSTGASEGSSHSGSRATAQDPQAKLHMLSVMSIGVKIHPNDARDKCVVPFPLPKSKSLWEMGKGGRKQVRPEETSEGTWGPGHRGRRKSCASVSLVCTGGTEEWLG